MGETKQEYAQRSTAGALDKATTTITPPRYEHQSGGINTLAYEPTSVNEAFYMARILVESGLTPKGMETPQKAFLVMAQGRELGLTTMQSLNNIYVVEGKVSLSSDLMAALILKSPVCEYLRCVEMSPERATYVAKRRGAGSAEFKFSYTWDDAKRAGLTSRATYQNNPGDMLRHRALSKCARTVFPDVISGLYSRDEVEDAVIDVSPRVESSPQPVTVTAPTEVVESTAKVRRRAASATVTTPAPAATGVTVQPLTTERLADPTLASAPEQHDAPVGALPHRSEDGSVIDPLSGEVLTGSVEEALFAQTGDAASDDDILAVQGAVSEAKQTLDPKRFASLRWLYFWSRHRVSGKAAPSDVQSLRAIQ
jgi:hypothetical protein